MKANPQKLIDTLKRLDNFQPINRFSQTAVIDSSIFTSDIPDNEMLMESVDIQA